MTISGKITLDDGSESEFELSAEGWQQWGATTERLGETVNVLEAMERALQEINA